MQTHDQPSTMDTPIDALSGPDAMKAMIASHLFAVEALRTASDSIERAAHLVAAAFEDGKSVHYAAAGSSGLMALADACELPGTFQVPNALIKVCMAGGIPVDGHMPGDTEDSEEGAILAAQAVHNGDVALVISASGTTPYALGFARAASARGAIVVGIANIDGSPLLKISNLAISLSTAPEVVEGSTRLGAGTAQKVALNMISTHAGILMGHVHDGMMVNLNPDNKKLRKRAADIVCRISSVTPREAEDALAQSGHNTKLATLVASGVTLDDAKELLNHYNGSLRACLQNLPNKNETTK